MSMFNRLFNKSQASAPNPQRAGVASFGSGQALHQPLGVNPQLRRGPAPAPVLPQRPQSLPPSLPPHPPQPKQPYHDPSVRFEPMPGNAPHSLPAAMGSPSELKAYLQGENNSIAFYESLAKAGNANDFQKEQASAILQSKRKSVQGLQNFHKQVAGNWAPEHNETAPVDDFKTAVTFALEQETRLLREATAIYAGLKDPAGQHFMNSLLYNKVADITLLMML